MNNIKVGYQRLVGKKPPLPVTKKELIPLLECMATKLKDETLAIRSEKDKDRQAELKRDTLPAIIISAATTCRKASDDDERTGLILIDLDDFGGKANPDVTYEQAVEIVDSMIGEYPFVIGRHTSVRRGLKVACGIEPRVDSHKRSFAALRKLFADHGLEVDRSTSDEKRANFLCWDADIIETLIEPLRQWSGAHIEPQAEVKKKPYKVKRSSSDSSLTPDEEIGLCLEHLHPDDDYQQWYQVGMIVKEHGGSCAIWDAWSSSGALYKAGECDKKWQSFKGGRLGFGTLVKWATDANGGRNPIMAEKNQRQAVKVTADDFDDVVADDEPQTPEPQKAKEPNAYHHNGRYYIMDGEGSRYIGIGSKPLEFHLRSLGYSRAESNGQLSAVDRERLNIITNHTVDHVGGIAGRPIGLTSSRGVKHLVTKKNERIVAKPGEWSTIRGILESAFKDQIDYIYSWLHRSRKQLELVSYSQGHVLTIAGKVGGGKSMFGEAIVAPMLGGMVKADRYLKGETTFNADLISSEMLFVDDKMGSNRSAEKRANWGESLKAFAAGSRTVSCHGKGSDAYSVNPLWRAVVCINDDDQSLGAFPPLGEGDSDSVGDKILLIKFFSDKPLPFTGEANQRELLADAIGADLPGFAHFIDNEYVTPEAIKTDKRDLRFGFNRFHHPSLLQTVNQNSNERTLLSVSDDCLFRDDLNLGVVLKLCKIATSAGRQYWEGTALEWSKILLKQDRHAAFSVVRSALAFGNNAKAAGKCLAKVAAVSDGRIIKKPTRTQTLWKIYETSQDHQGDAVGEDYF